MDSQREYLPIRDYGLIGDGQTAALVGIDGSVDWLCWPRFDSPSVFGALLDSGKAGRFVIQPDGPYTAEHRYDGDTNVLVTTFHTATGALVLTDFMLAGDGSRGEGAAARALYRVATCAEGRVDVTILFRPRQDYGRGVATMRQTGRVISLPEPDDLVLTSSVPLKLDGDAAYASATLRGGETVAIRLGSGRGVRLEWRDALDRTREYWREWIGFCTYDGPWRAAVVRSALALKLLIYEPTGAVVAAPTTSLPEVMGGQRNWDYRFAWLRDAGMTLNALYSLGFSDEAERYVDWVFDTVESCDPAQGLGVVYAVDGNRTLAEVTLDHLEGYRGSRPVRIGNEAHAQQQLDVYGELFDCLFVCQKFGRGRDPGVWSLLTRFVDLVIERWAEPDSGIWEVRQSPRHFVYSKAMAWAALDRAILAANNFSLPGDLERWRSERDRIREDVMRKGVAGQPPVLIRAYEDPGPDAANLLIAGSGLLPPDDPILAATIERTRRMLGYGPLVRRYVAADGLPGTEGAFLPASFWLAEALARIGRHDEGAKLFEEAQALGNGLGLLPEELDCDTHEYLGNYPQALSHIALINAALALDTAIEGERC